MSSPDRIRVATSGGVQEHPVVSHDDWIAARTAFLAKEKEFTRLRDALCRDRRSLPWERVDSPYRFETPTGAASLAQLFGPHRQLVVYHFMFAPEWEAGCAHCSFWADHYDGMQAHLAHRDVAMVAVSRAPLEKIETFKKRMGWSFPWVSSGGSEFNYDFHASFLPHDLQSGIAFFNYRLGNPGVTDREGASVFFRAGDGAVYHTYSCYGRGIDLLNGTYNVLDLVPKGRDEDGLRSPQAWVRYHDEYEGASR